MNRSSQRDDDDFPPTQPRLAADEEQSYAQTSPAPLAPAPAFSLDASLELAPIGAGEYELMAETRKDGRVCPQPTRWLEFYRILQDAARGGALPPPPLTGSAWAATPPDTKRACFAEQAAWAVRQGCIAEAHAFLSALPASDWHYGH